MLHKYSPSLHLDDLHCPVKSLEGEQSAVLAFYAGAQDAHVNCSLYLIAKGVGGREVIIIVWK